MRIHDQGDYAYDLEQTVDPYTQLRTGWVYKVFRIRPSEEMVDRGTATAREEAEKLAKRVISRLVQRERRAA